MEKYKQIAAIAAPIPVVLLGSRYLFKSSWPVAIGLAVLVGGAVTIINFKNSLT